MVADRFLVILTKLETEPKEKLPYQEITAMWERVPKSDTIQFKLKVDLSQEVLNKIAELSQGADKPSEEAKVAQTLKGNIADKMLSDSREPKKIPVPSMEDIKERDSEQSTPQQKKEAKPPQAAPAPA